MKRQTIGGILIAVGMASVPVSLMLYATVSFMIAQILMSGSVSEVGSPTGMIGNVLRVLIGLLPIVGIVICVPAGLYLIFTEGKKK